MDPAASGEISFLSHSEPQTAVKDHHDDDSVDNQELENYPTSFIAKSAKIFLKRLNTFRASREQNRLSTEKELPTTQSESV